MAPDPILVDNWVDALVSKGQHAVAGVLQWRMEVVPISSEVYYGAGGVNLGAVGPEDKTIERRWVLRKKQQRASLADDMGVVS